MEISFNGSANHRSKIMMLPTTNTHTVLSASGMYTRIDNFVICNHSTSVVDVKVYRNGSVNQNLYLPKLTINANEFVIINTPIYLALSDALIVQASVANAVNVIIDYIIVA